MTTRCIVLLAFLLLGGTAAASEPIFMMWQVQQTGPKGDFEELRSLGINTVQASRLATWPAADVQAYLDGAERTGLKVIVYLGIFRKGSDANCDYSPEALQFMRTYKSHPAIYAWHTVDEPAEHDITVACQRRLYRLVKTEDPGRPVMISTNNNSQSKYSRYFAEDAFDIFEMHKYVNPRPGVSQQLLMSLFKSNRRRDYPVIVTLRAYNAPQREKREAMTSDSLQEQYRFFIEEPKLTRNVAFYGWGLSPSVGIKDDPALREQFVTLMRSLKPVER